MNTPRRVLLIAYHFPPLAGSSGIQRTLRFVQHLPKFGWEPLVLTAQPRAYERTSPDLDAEVPPATVVRRAFALDTARQLSVKGRYIGATARPDRWVSWRFDGVRQGLRMIREFAPQVVWSTYPIATAHLIGAALQRRSGLPWVADFRDPMAQDGYPADPITWRQYEAIERDALGRAARSIFTTPGAAREYAHRYPGAEARIRVIENGYDEESFAAAESAPGERGPIHPGCATLLHSGIVYPSERDPSHLIQALQLLAERDVLAPGRMKLRFRASAHDSLIADLAQRHGVSPYVELLPPVGYREALSEMLRADALLVMQAANCNDQVPAKVYEYLRSGRPIFSLAAPAGDTAGLLRAAGVDSVPLDDASAIAQRIEEWLAGRAPGLLPTPESVRAASREARAAQLARELDALSGLLAR